MSRVYNLLQGIDNEVEVLQPRPKSIKQYGDPFGYNASGYTPSHTEKLQRARDVQGQGWIRMLAIVRKHWRLSALFAICVFVGVAIATLLTKPLYEAAVTLEIDPPGTQAFSLERGAGEGSDDAQYLETQAKELQSHELALAVIHKLDLDHDPDFVDVSKPTQNLPATTHNPGVAELTSNEDGVLSTFHSRLNVRRDTGSRLVMVSFAGHDPRTAAEVANALVTEFINAGFKARHEVIMQSSTWLSRQLDDIRAKRDQSNLAFVEFQKQTGIADLDPNKSTLAEEMSELDRQIALAESDRIQLEAFLASTQSGTSESLPQTGDNPVIQTLTQEVAEARAKLSQARVDYGVNHPALRKLQSEVDQLEKELDLQKRGVVDRLQTRYAAAQSRERLLKREQKLAAKQLNQLAQYNTLRKESQTQSELYNSLYARAKEAGIAAAANSYNVRVIDHAQVPRRPSHPRTLLNLGFGLLAAVFGGVMIAGVREALDTRIRTPEDILRATGIATVSVLPIIGEDDSARTMLASAFAQNLKMGWNGKHGAPKFLLERPNSAAAEALRGLYTTVMHSREGGSPQVLLVTSALAGEGKTTVALNLAIALSRRAPTCLVDADLRRAGVSRTFGLQERRGLADLLSGSAGLDEVIAQMPDVPNLSILPSGTTIQNPGELIAGKSGRHVVTTLRERFHFVVFDSSPILPYADGRILSTLVDGLIVVVLHRTTTRAAITRSVEVLSEIHAAPVLEVVLNGGNSIVSDRQYYCAY